jgi:hypothetical protein
MNYNELIEIVTRGGGTAVIVFMFIAAFKGWIVWKRELDREIERRKEIEDERDQWRELALKGTDLADRLEKKVIK